jgi:hypothetical protein
MVARGAKIVDPATKEVLAQYEVGVDGVGFIKFAQNKIIVKSKVEINGEPMNKTLTIPIGENILETVSDGKPVPEDYKAPQRQYQNQNQRQQGRVF